jgi:hypothetical protein
MTPAEFKARFPEFASETDARVQLFISDADSMFDVERWDTFYSVGVANYVAHQLAVANAQAATGAAGKLLDTKLSKKVGDLAVTNSELALTARMKDPFMATPYGVEYRRLCRLVGLGALAV